MGRGGTRGSLSIGADLEGAGVTWTNVPPLGPGPRSLAEHLEHLEWAAAEVVPVFR
jgi:hypothetical protein